MPSSRAPATLWREAHIAGAIRRCAACRCAADPTRLSVLIRGPAVVLRIMAPGAGLGRRGPLGRAGHLQVREPSLPLIPPSFAPRMCDQVDLQGIGPCLREAVRDLAARAGRTGLGARRLVQYWSGGVFGRKERAFSIFQGQPRLSRIMRFVAM